MFWKAEDLSQLSTPVRILILPSETEDIQPVITKKMSQKLYNEIQKTTAIPLMDLNMTPRERDIAFKNNCNAIVEADKHRGEVPPGTLTLLKPYVSADYLVILGITAYGQDWAEKKHIPPRILSPRTDFAKETQVGLGVSVYEISSGAKILSETILEKQPNSLHGELFDETEDSVVKKLWTKVYSSILEDIKVREPGRFVSPAEGKK
jgi:hypothetical protein